MIQQPLWKPLRLVHHGDFREELGIARSDRFLLCLQRAKRNSSFELGNEIVVLQQGNVSLHEIYLDATQP